MIRYAGGPLFTRILVPVDGSTFAEHALPHAIHAARSAGAELILALVHSRYAPVAMDPAMRRMMDEWEDAEAEREATYLKGLAARIAGEQGLAVTPRLLHGEIAPALLHEVRQAGASLVVMTTHGRAGLERAWLGSVADALLRELEAPALIVRPESDGAPASAPVPGYRRVLIALDGSGRAEKAIAPAIALAEHDARITLFRMAAPGAAVTSPFVPFAPRMSPEETRRRTDAAQEYLDGVAAAIDAPGRHIETTVAVNFHAARAILEHAAAHGADLIAMSTQGRSPVTRVVLGSSTDKVVRAASCPVLVC
jgi:nucleotide-binding universal stress UspA family protein